MSSLSGLGLAGEDAPDQRLAAQRRGRSSTPPGRRASPRCRRASAAAAPSRWRSRGPSCRRSRAGPRRAARRAEGLPGAGSPRRARLAISGGTVADMFVLIAEQTRRRWRAIVSVTALPQSPPCATNACSQGASSARPGLGDRRGHPSLARSACPRSRSRAATGSRRRRRQRRLPPYAVGSVSGPMIFSCSTTEPGQPWVMMIGRAFGVPRADVDEVDVEPVDLGQELRQRVQLRLERARVSARGPVRRARACIVRRGGRPGSRPRRSRALASVCRLDPAAQLVEVRLRELSTWNGRGIRLPIGARSFQAPLGPGS